jgi:hypothetical protein
LQLIFHRCECELKRLEINATTTATTTVKFKASLVIVGNVDVNF